MTTELDDLKKAIELAEGATEPLKKSQMAFEFTHGPNPHSAPHKSKYDRLAKKAGEQTEAAAGAERTNSADTAHMHHSAALAHFDAAKEATRTGKLTLASYHTQQAEAHHKAYTRTNASGTVSQIQAKGTPKVDDIVHVRLPVKGVPNTMSPPQQAQVVSTDGEHATVRHMASGEEHRVHVSQITSKPDTDKRVWVDPGKQRREMEAAVTARERNLKHPAFSQKAEFYNSAYLHDSKTGRQLDDYEGPFHPNGDPRKTLYTWVENGERQYSDKPKTTANSNLKDVATHAENTSYETWNKLNGKQGTREEHLAAAKELLNSSKMHQEAAKASDGKTASEHADKARNHLQMARDHKARADGALSEAEAGTHLKRVVTANYHFMYRKAVDWEDTNHTISSPYKSSTQRHEIAEKHIQGTDARHYTMKEVYGHDHARPGYDTFTEEFMETQRDAAHDPFVMKHPNGNKYIINPEGSDYARYIARVRKGE